MRLSDSLRCLLGGTVQGPNHAFPRGGLAGRRDTLPLSLALAQESLEGTGRRFSAVHWHSTFRYGLASARARAFPRTWDVDRLHVADGSSPADLLETVTSHAGVLSGERIFLRMRSDDPLLERARMSQFMPCFSEALLVGRGRTAPPPSIDGIGAFRRRQAMDEHSLFLLYSAATPAAVRSAIGMTLDQWKDSRETCGGRREEWVLEQNGKAQAWVCLEWLGHGFEAELMVHPDNPGLLAPALDHALSRGEQYTWLVPEYQEPLGRRLLERGFQEVGRYTLLLRATAARVKDTAMKPVEA